MARISLTSRSMFSTSLRVPGSTFPVSLYLPMPRIMLSTWPFKMVIGVFSSCEAAAKKSRRCRESSVICSMSSRSFWLACSSSFIAASRRFAIRFKLLARTPNSSVRSTLHSQVMSRFAIRLETRLISNTGRTRIRLHRNAPNAEISRISSNKRGSSSRKAIVNSLPAETAAVMLR